MLLAFKKGSQGDTLIRYDECLVYLNKDSSILIRRRERKAWSSAPPRLLRVSDTLGAQEDLHSALPRLLVAMAAVLVAIDCKSI